MDLATMETRFQDRCHGLASGLSTAEIDVFLNEIYVYAIPDELPGMLTSGEWNQDTTASKQDYTFPNCIHSVRRGATLDDNAIRSFFSSREMWSRYDQSNTDESKPYALLFENRTLTVFPVPDDTYTLWIPIRAYPNTAGVIAELTSAGLTNTTHALAVISGAAAEYLGDSGSYEAATFEQQRFQTYLSRLKGRSLVPARERHGGMTF